MTGDPHDDGALVGLLLLLLGLSLALAL